MGPANARCVGRPQFFGERNQPGPGIGANESHFVQLELDHLATTPVDPRVVEKMVHCLSMEGNFGNPASRSHEFGWNAEKAVDEARQNVAALVNADPKEIVFTSGATESDNLAIKGVAP